MKRNTNIRVNKGNGILVRKKIEESDKFVHLGVLCDKNLKLDELISTACSKIRKTYFGLADCGVYKSGLHPKQQDICIKLLCYQKLFLAANYGVISRTLNCSL
jgi:hypothetical protein